MKMSRKIVAMVLVLSLVAVLLPVAAFAATTGDVTCTVSGKLIAVNVTDGSVAYGTLASSATQNTTASGVNDTQTATNTGTVLENFKIKSSNATGGTQWTLGSSQGDNTFTHAASIDAGSSWAVNMTVPEAYVNLATNIADSANQTFDLQIGMPTIITDHSAKNITVTVLAEEA